MEKRKIKRDEDREIERLQDEKELLLLKQREEELDLSLEKRRLENIMCNICKTKICKCRKITTFFK